MALKRIHASLLIVAVLFVLANPPITDSYPYRDIRCIDYLAQNTLYGGQPECVQPPAIYAWGLVSKALLQPLTYFLVLVLNIV